METNWDIEFGKLKMEEAAKNFERTVREFRDAEEDLSRIYFLPQMIRQQLGNLKN